MFIGSYDRKYWVTIKAVVDGRVMHARVMAYVYATKQIKNEINGIDFSVKKNDFPEVEGPATGAPFSFIQEMRNCGEGTSSCPADQNEVEFIQGKMREAFRNDAVVQIQLI